jgi:hypothetical protein
MTLGSTQSLMKMSTRNIPGGKGGRCVRLTTSPPLHAECHGIWEPKPPGTLWATLGLLRESFTLPLLTLLIKIFVFVLGIEPRFLDGPAISVIAILDTLPVTK